MESKKKLSLIVTKSFLRGSKVNISLAFISKSYLMVPKTIRLNATNYFIMKASNKRQVQQIASNYLPDIDFKDFMKIFKENTKELYSFLVKDTTLSADNPIQFR